MFFADRHRHEERPRAKLKSPRDPSAKQSWPFPRFSSVFEMNVAKSSNAHTGRYVVSSALKNMHLFSRRTQNPSQMNESTLRRATWEQRALFLDGLFRNLDKQMFCVLAPATYLMSCGLRGRGGGSFPGSEHRQGMCNKAAQLSHL